MTPLHRVRSPVQRPADARLRRLDSRVATALVALLLLTSALFGAPATSAAAGRPQADRLPANTAGPADCTGLPLGKYGGTLTFTVDTISPVVVTADGGNTLTVTGTYTNTGPDPLSGLGYKYQRGDRLVDVAAVRAEMTKPCQPIAVIDKGFAELPGTLEPGAGQPFTASVPLVGSAADTLALAEPGVYPIMININGMVQENGEQVAARVGELHLLLTVLSVPDIAPSPGTEPTPGAIAGPGAGAGSTSGSAGPVTSGSASGPDAASNPAETANPPDPRGPSTGRTDGAAASQGTAPRGTAESTPATTVGSADGPAVASPTSPGAPAEAPLPVNLLWPLVDRPHLGVQGVFLNDDLVAEISPGGRLATLVDTLQSATVAPGSVTLVIDPELLDELDRMSSGYRVVADPGNPQLPLTPTLNPTTSERATATNATESTEPTGTGQNTTGSTAVEVTGSGQGSADQGGPGTGLTPGAPGPTAAGATSTAVSTSPIPAPPGTVPGTGKAAASAFLGKLRALAQTYPVLLLPYSDPDDVALVRAGMSATLSSAVARGKNVALRVLQNAEPAGDTVQLITDIAFPVDGLVDAATLRALASDGYQSVVLDAAAIPGPHPPSAAVLVDTGTGTGTATTLPAVISDSDLNGLLDDLVYQGLTTGWAIRVNILAALLAQECFDGTGTPAVLIPARTFSPDPQGVQFLTALLHTMAEQGVVAGTSLSAIAASATTVVTLDYPDSARRSELSSTYLQRLSRDMAAIRHMRAAVSAVDGPGGANPDDILDPLVDSLATAASAALRSKQLPNDSVLSTVEATLDQLYSGVSIKSTGGSYTLASGSAPLLLTLQNSLPYTVQVRVQVVGGGRAGLVTEDPGVKTIPAGRSLPYKLPATVNRSGSFTVRAQLVGPDGGPWGAPVQLNINSSAYGPLTLVLIIVAGGVLVLMVILRITQRWRARQARLAGTATSAP